MKTILKVLVGSKAHKLDTLDSDSDYRGVFVVPTREILSLNGSTKHTSWLEGKEDDTSFEIGKFLFMALQNNPSILEVFKAPIVRLPNNYQEYGDELQSLFPYIWQPRRITDAFIGYGLNQRKKFLDDKDKRKDKYACAYLRTLYMANQLLTTGDMEIDTSKWPIHETLRRFKTGQYQVGEVIDICISYEKMVKKALEENPENKYFNPDKVNDFLIKVRKDFWNEN